MTGCGNHNYGFLKDESRIVGPIIGSVIGSVTGPTMNSIMESVMRLIMYLTELNRIYIPSF